MKNLKKFIRNICRTSVLGLAAIFLSFGVYLANDNSDLSCENDKPVFCEQAEENKDNSEIVYVTKTGKCCHKSGCYCLKHSRIEIPKKEAQEHEYSECKKCFG